MMTMDQNGSTGLRKRPARNANTPLHVKSIATGGTATLDRKFNSPKYGSKWSLWMIAVALHLGAVLWMIAGFVLRNQLHTGIECEMTYSRFQFFPIPISTTQPFYHLYKFADRQDPRHVRDQVDWCGVEKSDHPISKRHIVLYIPGHWGSYDQARSLGAHGIQLTRRNTPRQYIRNVAEALLTGAWNGKATTEKEFVYDVYAVDFSEQGTALHGKFLMDQSKFVAEAVSILTEVCQVSSVTIVAHSVGGLVARSVPILYPHTQPLIRNIITLATPHIQLPYAAEQGVDKFFSILSNKTSLENTLVISISGGIRDDLIPPDLCHVNDVVPNGITVLAHEIMLPSREGHVPLFGMDHKCIVWCHNLLTVVRSMIFTLAVAEERGDSIDKKLKAIRGIIETSHDEKIVDSFLSRVKQLEDKFRATQGFLRSVAAESAMLYHCELFMSLYALITALHLMYSFIPHYAAVWSWYAVPTMTTGMGWIWSNRTNLRLITILILALTSNGLFKCIQYGLFLVANYFCKKTPSKLPTRFMARTLLFAWLLPSVVIYLTLLLFSNAIFADHVGQNVQQHPFVILFGWSVLFILGFAVLSVTLEDDIRQRQHTVFVISVLPILPCLLVGKASMVIWAISEKSDSTESMNSSENMENDLRRTFSRILLPIAINLITFSSLSRGGNARAVRSSRINASYLIVICLAVLWFGPQMLHVGGGYTVGYFLASLAWIHAILDALFYLTVL